MCGVHLMNRQKEGAAGGAGQIAGRIFGIAIDCRNYKV